MCNKLREITFLLAISNNPSVAGRAHGSQPPPCRIPVATHTFLKLELLNDQKLALRLNEASRTFNLEASLLRGDDDECFSSSERQSTPSDMRCQCEPVIYGFRCGGERCPPYKRSTRTDRENKTFNVEAALSASSPRHRSATSSQPQCSRHIQ